MALPTINDYLANITSEYQESPNYLAMISYSASIYTYLQGLIASMPFLFGVQTAIGVQLDIVGLWVGISRQVNIPISGVFFSWNGPDYTTGWNYGVWQSSTNNSVVTVLPDDVYRTLILAKIAANNWDGTTESAYTIWSRLFPNLTILIQDNENMTYDLAFVGGPVDSLTAALVTGGYIPLKPEGVRVDNYFFPVDTNPLFGWDLNTDFVKGWNTGSWAAETRGT